VLRTTAVLSLALNLVAAAGHAQVNGVVPAKEQMPTDHHQRPGPANLTQGVLAIRRLGAQPLDRDFPALAGRELRVREITIAPGGSIALHRHNHRPGLAYILEGQMTERRGPGFAPLVLGPGGVALESTGVTHWWRNEGAIPARALVVDIVPKGTP